MPILNTFTSAAARAFKSVVSSVIDPFFSSVGLLLHGDLFGTTNQNNTFLDSSSNNFGITNTSVVQGSFSPYSPSGNYDPTTQGGSGYFNGSSQLFIASNSQTAVGSGDFAIEVWVYFTSNAAVQCIAQNDTVYGGGRFYFGKHATGEMTFWVGSFNPSGPLLTDTIPTPANQWIHFAVTRSGSTFRLFRNGTQAATATYSGSVTGVSNPLYIGTQGTQGNSTTGYLSGFRIVKGTAVYTSNFTPPTSPVANIAGTGLLLNFANAAAYDASAKTNVATLVNAAVSSVQKKFGTGSLYLDGSSSFQYIEQGSTAIGTGDFTIELWFYKNSALGTNQYARILSSPSFIIQDSWNIGLRFLSTTPTVELFYGPQLSVGSWNHLAITRAGNVFRCFVNGVQSSGTTNAYTNSTTGNAFIGSVDNVSEFFNGYIDEFRLTKGVARYTASFTAPDAPYPNSFGAASSWSMFSTGTSNDFDGIYLNNQTDFAFGTGDFTIEFFVNLSSSGSNQVLYDSRPSGTNGAYTSIYLDAATTKIYFYTNSSNVISQSSTFTYNTWHHIVATRTGTNTKLFIDGVQEGSTYIDNSNYLIGAGRPFTGNGNTPPVSGIVGYVSNLRVVKGSGPYQGAGSTILVPTSPLTSVPNTVLLTLNSEAFIDLNTVLPAKTINLFNNPTMVRFAPF